MPQEPYDKPTILQYGQPPPRRCRGFHPDAPFWRNWLFGVLMMGLGVLALPSRSDPQNGRLLCYGLMIWGAIIVVGSSIRAIGVFVGKWPD